MRKNIILVGSIAASVMSAQAAVISFTDGTFSGATISQGTLTPSTVADNDVVTSLSYTVTGLTIDGNGTANDDVTFTIALTSNVSFITADFNNGTPEFDVGLSGTFSSNDFVTFGPIQVSGTSSGGQSYVLNSAIFDEVTVRRFTSDNDVNAVVGDVTTFTGNTANSIALADTFFTLTTTSGSNNLRFVDFTVDVGVIPEPSSSALFGLAGLALLARRGRK